MNEESLQITSSVCKSLADIARSNYGPKGSYKLVISNIDDQTNKSESIRIIKEGNELLQNVTLQHPVGLLIRKLAHLQYSYSGDSTCAVILLTGQLLHEAKHLVFNKGIHPNIIRKSFENAAQIASLQLEELKLNLLSDSLPNNFQELMNFPINPKLGLLSQIAVSTLATKIDDNEVVNQLAEICIEAIQCIAGGKKVVELKESRIVLSDIGIVPIAVTPNLQDLETNQVNAGMIIRGIVVQQGPRDPNMPLRIKDARVLLLNEPLETRSDDEATIQYHSIQEKQRWVASEQKVLEQKIKKIVSLGVTCILSFSAIDPFCMNLLAKNGILALRHIRQDLMSSFSKALKIPVISSLNQLTESTQIATVRSVYVKHIGSQVYTFLEEILENPRAVTILLQSSIPQQLTINYRAVMQVLANLRNCYEDCFAVPGAGSTEMAIARAVRNFSASNSVEKRIFKAFAKSLENIVASLISNSGFNSFQTLFEKYEKFTTTKATDISQVCSQNQSMWAIDLETGQLMDPVQKGVIDTYRSKVQLLSSAVDTVGIILRIDRVLRSSDRVARLRKELEMAQKEEEERKKLEKKEEEESHAMYRQRFSNSASTIASDKNIHNTTYKRQEQQFYSQEQIQYRKSLEAQFKDAQSFQTLSQRESKLRSSQLKSELDRLSNELGLQYTN